MTRLSASRPHELPTLRELLRRPAFQEAEILAGRQGLDVPVRWVHVGEIPDIARYLRGQELLLSTGVGLHRPQERRRYLERLAECEVAGVCIELGRYLRRIPDDMLQLADRLELPLIAFVRPVRFVDITRDVHAVILQGEKQILLSLQQLAEDLRRLPPNSDGNAEIVHRLSLWLDAAALWLPPEGEPICSGPAAHLTALEAKARDLLRALRLGPAAQGNALLPDGSGLVSRLVPAQEGGSGLLVAVCRSGGEVATGMALDLAAAALAQAAPKAARDSRASPGDDVLLAMLLGGEGPRLAPQSLQRFAPAGRLPRRGVLVLLRHPGGDPAALVADLRAAVRRQSLAALVGRRAGDAALLLFDPGPRSELRRLVVDLRALASRSGGAAAGVSGSLPLDGLAQALPEADLALAAAIWSDGTTSSFYDELGALRILANLSAGFDTAAPIEQELGPLLAYDRRHRTTLVQTLDVLLKAAHKDEAAQRLGIRRQTLYYRIERIASLLGEDFLRPERRLGLSLALLARTLESVKDSGHSVTELDPDF